MLKEITSKKPNKKIILLGNDAIVRGALEAGVQFVSTFPGTPASEIGNTFYQIQNSEYKIRNLHFEYSVNEKVAMEAGIGASFSGLKTLVAMKHFGVNVCSDALLPFLYTGSKGPTVIAVSDDPNCWSSAQSEQNSRVYSYLAHLPTLEPSDSQECKDFTKIAFKISEKFKIPVMVRLTTRVSHQRMPVKLSNLPKFNSKGVFIKDIERFVTMPPRVLKMKDELLKKVKEIKKFSEKLKIVREESPSNNKLGLITSGISYLYLKEALQELKLDIPILKLGIFYPLPEKEIKKFIKSKNKVFVLEELEPCLEKEINILAKEVNSNLKVIGKDLLPETGEFKPEMIINALAEFAGVKYKEPKSKAKVPSVKHIPQLCPGCPYWLIFNAVKRAVDEKKVIFGGDIGCYMLGGLPPHNLQDYLSCMGASIGIAHGIKKSTKNQKLIAFIGDGTFFHAGIPALINTVFNNSNPLIIVTDNRITAMTGHQPNPGADNVTQRIKIEDIVRACGVKNLKVIDPAKQKEFIETIKNFINKKEVSVIIARRPCVFLTRKNGTKK